ncbi:ribosomal-protein-alanine N-acetyltransferase [Methanosarcinales archaeon]|nr:MAG: ribosomal-protein-alanine N-acetyltransferase [Methanosarcinales archaeon]
MRVRIRRFERRDLDDIMEIEKKAFPKTPYSRFTFMFYAFALPRNFLVCEDEERKRVVGYIIFHDDGHVVSVAVHPSMRRKGIGRALMNEVLKRTGGKAVVEVRESNETAIKFYKKLGFTFKTRIPNYYGDEDALIMSR